MEVWDLYFASVVTMSLHPGYEREGANRLTLRECADLADRMVRLRGERELKELGVWPDGQR